MASVERTVLVVGAGLAGAVHARRLAEAGFHVEVIDRRPHVAGNAYDEIGPGRRPRPPLRAPPVPHRQPGRDRLDRGSTRTGCPTPTASGRCCPQALLAPLPINLDTMNVVFGTSLADEAQARAHLAAVAVPIADAGQCGGIPRLADRHRAARPVLSSLHPQDVGDGSRGARRRGGQAAAAALRPPRHLLSPTARRS